MKIQLFLILMLVPLMAPALDLSEASIVVADEEPALVHKMAQVLSDDIYRVCRKRPAIVSSKKSGVRVELTCTQVPGEIQGSWERYQITTTDNVVRVAGSDPRGLAYGVLHISEKMGIDPWYWWADIPVMYNPHLAYIEQVTSKSPAVKYRGFFINDEDWGLNTWAKRNFEKDLNDIGPKTYDKVCELILRLRGNMLAPAMHSCTGAFYSHPESQKAAADWGIMITTSHCEPMLFNNAAHTEWDKQRDGEWNYETNSETIRRKFDNRLAETARYDNIYTMGMRGLHDEAMKGSANPRDRARTLERVFADQRAILEKYKQKGAPEIPQIFVPYKETLDIYDAGLRVPEDITIIWPDDNYGYMKRVSNPQESQRKGRAGVYYHVSYLGTPHDNLWIQSTAPVLMYEELKKAYDAGADRYWLLNVGDIKPMELAVQQFFTMAFDLQDFNYEKANRYQAWWLGQQFRDELEPRFQKILDTYYRLAWDRKPEFMGYEMQWSSDEQNKLHDTHYSFSDGTAQRRLADYRRIADECDAIGKELPESLRPAFFEILEFMVKGAYQMNRKFLMAQLNHETGLEAAAQESENAYNAIQQLVDKYNNQLDGKWNQMMSQLPPGMNSKYHLMPELVSEPTNRFRLSDDQWLTDFSKKVDLKSVRVSDPFRLIEGIGTDWVAIQMGEPLDDVQNPASMASSRVDIPLADIPADAEKVKVCVAVVPFWPVFASRSNCIGVSLDGKAPVVCENKVEEWSFPWKVQVLYNRKDFVLTLPLDKSRDTHTLSLIIGDPGQIIQKISYQIED